MTSKLPPGWAWVSVGEVLDARNGRAFKSTEWRQTGTPIIRIQNLKDADAAFNYFDGSLEQKHAVKPGDLLFAWSGTPGTSFGAHVWKGIDAALNQHIFRLDFERTAFNTDYLCYALNQNVARYIEQAQGGVGLAHITKAKFDASLLPVPPTNEQNRIVNRLDELFSRIDEGERALERVQKLVERYRQSVLKAAVTGELTRDWREKNKDKLESGEALLVRILKARREAWEKAELSRLKAKGITPANDKWKQRYKEPSRPDIGGLRDLPQGWTWATVEQISTKVVDGVHSKPNYVASGIPFVTVKNLTAGPGISFDRLNYITATDHAEFIKRTDPERGDVLISKDGTLGVVRVIRTDTTFSIFVSVALVKPVVRTMGEFVGIALSSPVVQAQMVPKGSGLQHIHLEDLRRDCIPLPSLEEQQVIVDLVAAQMVGIDHVEADLAAYTKKTRNLRQSVLSSAFSGSLAPQSPADEDAAALLERIASERADAPAKSKRGRKTKNQESA